MALSYKQYSADGATRDFSVPFQYIDRRHVTVLVDGVAVPFTWLSNFTIRATSLPALGTVITVKRSTPKDQVLVDYVDGSTLTESDLDLGTVQNFFLAQEAYDVAEGTLSINDDGSYSAGNRRIGEVADPVLPHQAATKNYVDTAAASQVQQATAERLRAEMARGGAEAAETRSRQEATASASSAAQSATARDSSSGHRLNAQNAERGAVAAADRSEAGATRSEQALSALSGEVAQAEAARDAAEQHRDAARVYRDEARTFDPAEFYTKGQADGRFAALNHIHTIDAVSGLQAALNGKAATSHTHTVANVTGLQAALDAKVATTTANTNYIGGVRRGALVAISQYQQSGYTVTAAPEGSFLTQIWQSNGDRSIQFPGASPLQVLLRSTGVWANITG